MLADAGMVVGIKVDTGAKPLTGHAGEKVTDELDGLRERLTGYAAIGERFANWRAVIAIDAGLPTHACSAANAHALTRYAALCQEAELVPVVEFELLMAGEHTLQRGGDISAQVLHEVFEQLHVQRVALKGLLLKPSMVRPGLACAHQDSVDEVADAPMTGLLGAVAAAVPGIAFLSGGQSPELACARLNAMKLRFKSRLPWALAFSFTYAIQQPALDIWRGEPDNVPQAQRALQRRAARQSEYAAAIDGPA